MDDFVDYRFSQRVLNGFTGGPRWNTGRTQMLSGKERRNVNWPMPKFEFKADYATFGEVERDEIQGAFMALRGAAYAFRFRDHNDFQARSEIIGLGDGSSTPMQLTRTYRFGPASYVRKIHLPLNPRLYADGALVVAAVDPLTGMATPAVPWPDGAVITWIGQFDVRVTFADDFNPFTAVAGKVGQCSVGLIEDWGL